MRPFTLSLVLLIAIITSVHSQSDLIGFWHNCPSSDPLYLPIQDIDPRYNIINVSYAKPDFGSTSEIVFQPKAGTEDELIAHITYLKEQGRKVLLSIGGPSSTVKIESEVEEFEFILSVFDLIKKYNFDGIDISFEGNSLSLTGGTITAPVDASLTYLISAIEVLLENFKVKFNTDMLLTFSPKTSNAQGGLNSFSGPWGSYLPLLHRFRNDLYKCNIQLFNSGLLTGLDGNLYFNGNADFIISQVDMMIRGFSTQGGIFFPLSEEQISVGLPTCDEAVSSGFTPANETTAGVSYLLGDINAPGLYELPTSYPDLGGMTGWNINYDQLPDCSHSYYFATHYDELFNGIVNIKEPQEEHLNSKFTIFPNPISTSQFINIKTSEKVDLEWISLSGQVIPASLSQPTIVPTSGLIQILSPSIPGIYVLRGKGANSFVRKVIVQ